MDTKSAKNQDVTELRYKPSTDYNPTLTIVTGLISDDRHLTLIIVTDLISDDRNPMRDNANDEQDRDGRRPQDIHGR